MSTFARALTMASETTQASLLKVWLIFFSPLSFGVILFYLHTLVLSSIFQVFE